MILDGKLVSSKIKEELKKEIEDNKLKIGMAVIQVGDDPASNVYIKNKEKVAKELGVNFEHIKFDLDITEDLVIQKIQKLNNDNNIDGIIVQLPLPEHLNKELILNEIDEFKDIDGLTIKNIGKLFSGNDGIISCTPYGVIKLIEYYNLDLEGKNAVIIGRSNLVGKPLIELLLRKNATVTVCHSKTPKLKKITKKADIIIAAVGRKNLITKDMVKRGCIVIDVGINRIDNKICGDVDFKNVQKKASYITPVPGGVGPMTVAMLFYNLIKKSDN